MIKISGPWPGNLHLAKLPVDFLKPFDLVLIIPLFSFQQVKSGCIFDNFLLTNNEEFAEEAGNKTWGIRKVRFFPPLDFQVSDSSVGHCSLHLKNQSHSHCLICWLNGPERQGKELVFIGHLRPCT